MKMDLEVKICPECGEMLYYWRGRFRHLYSLEDIFRNVKFCNFVCRKEVKKDKRRSKAKELRYELG